MSDHDCPRLSRCLCHPRWRVHKDGLSSEWITEPPGPMDTDTWGVFPTHAEAIQFAQKEATR